MIILLEGNTRQKYYLALGSGIFLFCTMHVWHSIRTGTIKRHEQMLHRQQVLHSNVADISHNIAFLIFKCMSGKTEHVNVLRDIRQMSRNTVHRWSNTCRVFHFGKLKYKYCWLSKYVYIQVKLILSTATLVRVSTQTIYTFYQRTKFYAIA